MTRKIVKRSTFFAPHCPSLCSQILNHCHLNPFWPKKAKIVCSGGSWIVGFTNSIGGADVENIETFGATFCGRNYLLRFLEYSLGIYLFCFAPMQYFFPHSSILSNTFLFQVQAANEVKREGAISGRHFETLTWKGVARWPTGSHWWDCTCFIHEHCWHNKKCAIV